jgi:hypothetical protein
LFQNFNYLSFIFRGESHGHCQRFVETLDVTNRAANALVDIVDEVAANLIAGKVIRSRYHNYQLLFSFSVIIIHEICAKVKYLICNKFPFLAEPRIFTTTEFQLAADRVVSFSSPNVAACRGPKIGGFNFLQLQLV